MELAPEEPRFGYIYAIALHTAGRTREARTVVEAGLKRVPGDPLLNALRPRLAEEVRQR